MAHDPNPVSPVSPGGREVLTVAEFERTMQMRSQMLDAQFSEVRTLVTTGFGGLHAAIDGITARQDAANGRLGKAETEIGEVRTNGCAKFETHRALLDAMGEAPAAPRRWHQKPVIQGAGGTGIVLGLIEVVKLLLTHKW